MAPHQLRHADAVEMTHEGVPLVVIQRQIGHANLGITSIYLQGIDNAEIINAVQGRAAPMIPQPLDSAGRAEGECEQHRAGHQGHTAVARDVRGQRPGDWFSALAPHGPGRRAAGRVWPSASGCDTE